MRQEIPFEAAQKQFAIDQHAILASTNLVGTFLHVNSRFCTISGYPREELIGKNHSILNSGTHSKFFFKEMYDSLESGNTWQGEIQSRAKDGRNFWVYATIVPLKNTEGKIEQFYIICTDITNRKNIETELRIQQIELEKQNKELFQVKEELLEREIKLRVLLMSIEAGVIVHAPDTSVLMSNPKASELFGLSEDELRGKHALDTGWNFFDEKNIPLSIENFPVNQIKTTKSPIKGQIMGIKRHQKNDLVWVMVNGFPIIDFEGEISQIIISFLEVTEIIHADMLLQLQNRELTQMNEELIRSKEAILESEIRYKRLFNGAAEGIAVADVNTKKFLYANPSLCRMFGYSEEAFQNLSVMDIHPKESLAHVISEFEAQARGDKNVAYDMPCIRNDGSIFFANISATPIELDGRNCNVGFFTDITEHKQTEDKLNITLKELEKLNNTKNTFFKIIAHDLRNPFMGINGIAEMIESSLLSEKKHDLENLVKYVQLIRASSQSASNLLENLMKWAMSQTGEIKINLQNIHVRNLISTTISPINANAFRKNITIEEDILENDMVYADIPLANTILRNLIMNAIKFTNHNGRIVISTNKNMEGFLEISVTDTGIGIETKNLEKLFKIDSKFSSPGTDKEKGTGLGLILCKEFVEKLGGTIWVRSEFGKGSTFSFTLPLGR